MDYQQKKGKKKEVVAVDTQIYGKVPPQARNMECAILGAIMLEPGALDLVVEILKPQCFYLESHQRIFSAMCHLSQKSQPVDILTVVERLKETQELDIVGGPYFVTTLTNGVTESASIENHSRIVLEKFIKREMIRLGGETVAEAYDDSTDTFDLLDSHEKKFSELTSTHLKKGFSRIDDELVKSVTRIEHLRKLKEHVTGIPSGFFDLDRVTHGWQNTDLIILAARPAVGKTAFALNLARNAAMNKKLNVPVAFFSLEMSAGQLVNRIISSESEVWLEKISNGQLDDIEMETIYKRGIHPLSTAPIFIDDTAALNIFELRAKCRRLKNKHNVGLIIIDYLQLMSGTGDRNSNREQEISRISRDLKGLAKQLQVPIIALSQLSRETEKRSGDKKMPQLSDLRESGAIEQDADMVMFLYRPEYYDQKAGDVGDSVTGETHLKIAKHRNGKLENIKLRADLAIQKFYSWDGLQDVKKALGSGTWKPVDLPYKDNDELPFS